MCFLLFLWEWMKIKRCYESWACWTIIFPLFAVRKIRLTEYAARLFTIHYVFTFYYAFFSSYSAHTLEDYFLVSNALSHSLADEIYSQNSKSIKKVAPHLYRIGVDCKPNFWLQFSSSRNGLFNILKFAQRSEN